MDNGFLPPHHEMDPVMIVLMENYEMEKMKNIKEKRMEVEVGLNQ